MRRRLRHSLGRAEIGAASSEIPHLIIIDKEGLKVIIPSL